MKSAIAAMRVQAALANDWYSKRLSSKLEERVAEVEAGARARAEESAEIAVRMVSSRHRSEAGRLRQERDALKTQLLALKMSAGKLQESSGLRTAASLLSDADGSGSGMSKREQDKQVADVIAAARISVLEDDLRVLRDGTTSERELLLERIEALTKLVVNTNEANSRPSSRHVSPQQEDTQSRRVLPEVPFSPSSQERSSNSGMEAISVGTPVMNGERETPEKDMNRFVANDREQIKEDIRKLRVTLHQTASGNNNTVGLTRQPLSRSRLRFDEYDLNGDGVIDRREFETADQWLQNTALQQDSSIAGHQNPPSPSRVANSALDAFKKLRRDYA